MGMMYHHKNEMMGPAWIVLAIIGLIVFAVLVYELMMNRSWIVEHIPSEVKQAIPEPVTKALEKA